MHDDDIQMLRFKVVVEAVPGALSRVLESLDARGVVPLSVVSRRAVIRGTVASVPAA